MEYYEISSTHCDDVYFFHSYIENIYHNMPLEESYKSLIKSERPPIACNKIDEIAGISDEF